MIGGGDRIGIEHHAVLLDGRGAALVADDGTIDWWAPDRIDAPPVAWRLLDPLGGALRVGPVSVAGRAPMRGHQRWVGPSATSVVTRFETPTGVIEVTDLLVRPTAAAGPGTLLRVVDCRGGTVDVEISLAPGRGWRTAARVSCFDGGVSFDGLTLRAPGFVFAPAPVTPGSDRGGVHAVRTLNAGERAWLVVGRAGVVGGDLSPGDVRDLATRTEAVATSLDSRAQTSGTYAAAVRRSALVLWGLNIDGWLARSVTTSLPAKVSVDRTVDGRHAWLHDAATAVPILVELGFEDQAAAIAARLGDVLRDGGCVSPARQIGGALPSPAEERRELTGRRGTQPVLEGLGDERVAGSDDRWTMAALIEVAAATHARSWSSVTPLADRLADDDGWRTPDGGPWDLARRDQPLTAPLVGAWHALLAARDEERTRDLLSLDAAAWHGAAQRIAVDVAAAVTPTGWLPMAATGDLARVPDAALLSLCWTEQLPVAPEVAARTLDVILERCGEGMLVRRYPEDTPDGRPMGDSPQLSTSFDAVRALAALDRWEEAHERMDTLVGGAAQRLGVLSESVDPVSGASLGNVPDAPAHLSLIAAAIALDAGPR